jgi:hypothetical protein
VLSYGSKEYANMVIDKAVRIFGEEKVEVIKDPMPYDDYVEYINTVDIAILDYQHQSALGNFYLLSLFGKKIYLNDDGILMLCTVMEGGKPNYVSDIGIESYEEFVKPLSSKESEVMRKFAEYYFDEEIAVQNWKYSFEGIKRK